MNGFGKIQDQFRHGASHNNQKSNLLYYLLKDTIALGRPGPSNPCHHAQAKYTYTPDLPHERTDHPTPVD
jgi:hypothetical protein